MDPDFWLRRWEQGQTGWHEGVPNVMLTRHAATLGIAPGARVFVPLCGKTRDIGWLLAQGFRIAGAELSELAVTELFAELGVAPDILPAGEHRHFRGDGIDIFIGDIFRLDAARLGPVDAIHDRAALVALPADMRARYASHLVALTGGAPQLLSCFEYDQGLIAGPPFSVSGEEVARLYADHYDISLLDRGDLSGGVRGTPAAEVIWHLRRPA